MARIFLRVDRKYRVHSELSKEKEQEKKCSEHYLKVDVIKKIR